MEDAVAGRRVVRLLDAVLRRELRGRSPVCLSSSSLAGEDEVIVGDRRLPRIDRVAAGDLVEGVDRERRGAVRRRQQIGVDAQRRRPGVTCAASLSTRCAHTICSVVVIAARVLAIGPVDRRRAFDRRAELAPSDGEDAAAPADLVFLGVSGTGS